MERNQSAQASERDYGSSSGGPSAQNSSEKLSFPGRGWLYAGPGRKPRLLEKLENYVKTELLAIGTADPQLKLKVYQNAFCCIIEEFRTYQPILCAIQREYESTIAYLQDQNGELGLLRSRLRLMTEECDRKFMERWEEVQDEIQTLKNDRENLQRELKALKEKEVDLQAMVERLQSELSVQDLRYKEEIHAYKLLIDKHNARSSLSKEKPTGAEAEDPVVLRLALKVCREDLSKAQMELIHHSDAMRNREDLQEAHRQTLHQLERLQYDFAKVRSENAVLRQLHQEDKKQADPDSPMDGQGNEEVLRASPEQKEDSLQQQSDSAKTCSPPP